MSRSHRVRPWARTGAWRYRARAAWRFVSSTVSHAPWLPLALAAALTIALNVVIEHGGNRTLVAVSAGCVAYLWASALWRGARIARRAGKW